MTGRNRVPATVWRDPWQFLAFGCGSGAMPFAPGTFGTLPGVLLYWWLQDLNLSWYLLVVALLFGFGVWLCQRVSQQLGVHDHSGIVWDEIVGYLVTMTLAPPGIGWMIGGFVLFRVFDITKPWPIHAIDRQVMGGLGIMLDDVVAAVLAAVCLQALTLFIG
ncbi:MAG: phosphatidylglycerophosphatase A [Gammaproteobacteria bacterium]|nr:phosphatidylglycerophosphatase A [Gammaproteobacteria bacterium]